MEHIILIRYGDITLKGRNKNRFIDTLNAHIYWVLKDNQVTYEHAHQRIYIRFTNKDAPAIIDKLLKIPGIHSLSIVKEASLELNKIEEVMASLIEPNHYKTFKVHTKRMNKNFPTPSMEVSKKLGGMMLKRYQSLSVDVHQPDVLITVEIRQHRALVYANKIAALGGFPVGTTGSAYLLLSGGIDSSVAGFLTMKQGVSIEAVHFESTPLTSIESAQKVLDLTKKLSVFAKKGTIKLHYVPFKAMHEAIMKMVPKPYHITIMRRMMLRFIETLAEQHHVPAIVTGESIGQVASQTLESMKVINDVTSRPVLRPLATYDKQSIIEIAKQIHTYDIAIRPFDDCCSIYVPKKPVTNPRVFYALRYERLFDYKSLLKNMHEETISLDIRGNSQIDLTLKGFTVKEAMGVYFND